LCGLGPPCEVAEGAKDDADPGQKPTPRYRALRAAFPCEGDGTAVLCLAVQIGLTKSIQLGGEVGVEHDASVEWVKAAVMVIGVASGLILEAGSLTRRVTANPRR